MHESNLPYWRPWRSWLATIGRTIDQAENILEVEGISAFRIVQQYYKSLASSDAEASDYDVYRKERAAEILSSLRFMGDHHSSGDGYASPTLNALRAEERNKLAPDSVVGRFEDLMRRQPEVFSSDWAHIVQEVREKIWRESLEIPNEFGRFALDLHEERVNAIRSAALRFGASEVCGAPKKLGSYQILFSLDECANLRLAASLFKPNFSQDPFRVLLDWRFFIVYDGERRAAGGRVSLEKDFPVLLDLAIPGLTHYWTCYSAKEVALAVKAVVVLGRWLLGELSRRPLASE